MFAGMIFRKEPFFHGHDNYDQLVKIAKVNLIKISDDPSQLSAGGGGGGGGVRSRSLAFFFFFFFSHVGLKESYHVHTMGWRAR